MKRLFYAVFIVIFLLSSSIFAMSQEEARNELSKRNIPYSDQVIFTYIATGNNEVVKLFLDAGTSPNIRTPQGQTALVVACLYKHRDVVQTLLDAGADVNAKIDPWEAPLFYAVLSGDAGLVDLLLAKGADTSIKSKSGKTAATVAKELGHDDIAKKLGENTSKDSTNSISSTGISIPSDYPSIKSKTSLVMLDDQGIQQIKEEAHKLVETKKSCGDSYFLDMLSYGYFSGKTDLMFYLSTPYSSVRYEFYKAEMQFKPVNQENINYRLSTKDIVYIIVSPYDAVQQNIVENRSGGALYKAETIITNVVIRKNGVIYQSLKKIGDCWAFPIDLFSNDNTEVIAVDFQNEQKVMKLSGKKISQFK
jgi:hypothetical protein